jgi:hypothetical protein
MQRCNITIIYKNRSQREVLTLITRFYVQIEKITGEIRLRKPISHAPQKNMHKTIKIFNSVNSDLAIQNFTTFSFK